MTYLFPPIGTSDQLWTPALTFGGGSTGITYNSTPQGWYTITENKVVFSFILPLKTVGSSTGNATITIPFTSNSSVTIIIFTPSYFNMTLTANSSPMAQITSNSTVMNLAYQNSGTYAQLDNSNFNANCQVSGSGFYFI